MGIRQRIELVCDNCGRVYLENPEYNTPLLAVRQARQHGWTITAAELVICPSCRKRRKKKEGE